MSGHEFRSVGQPAAALLALLCANRDSSRQVAMQALLAFRLGSRHSFVIGALDSARTPRQASRPFDRPHVGYRFSERTSQEALSEQNSEYLRSASKRSA